MCSPESFEVVTINISWRSPTLWRSKDNHRPSGSEGFLLLSSLLLVSSDVVDTLFDGTGHGLVHRVEVRALDEVRSPTVSDE
jgi:hypothetical protein